MTSLELIHESRKLMKPLGVIYIEWEILEKLRNVCTSLKSKVQYKGRVWSHVEWNLCGFRESFIDAYK